MERFQQSIPWFKEKYLKEKWEKRKSSRYIFYYFKNSLAERGIDKIAERKERDYKKIVNFLGIDIRKKIKYYLYPSMKIKKELMGDDSLGNAIWQEVLIERNRVKSKRFEIHVVYSRKYKFIGPHEDTHLLSLPWGLPIYLFQEGLAQFMEGDFLGKDLDILSKEIIKRGKNYSISWLFDNRNWKNLNPKILYPLVGSFVKFLITKYGKDKFEKIYRKTSRSQSMKKNLKVIRKIYSKDIKKLEREWKEYLDKI